MHQTSFLQDLAIVMSVAALATIIFRQLNQPVVLGYILAGVIIGPHTPPFALIADEHAIETLAELGIIFLMFALGLEFSLRKLRQVGATAFIAASLEILLMLLAGYGLGRAFGWNTMDSVFLGAILSISSTTIIIKALEGLGKTRERFANLIFGILIVEDILAIVLIALLSGFARTGEVEAQTIGMTILSLSSFLGILLVAGLIVVPRLLDYVARFKSDEMLLITVVGLCFGISLVTVKLGYSVALGAFLIGAVIAEARQIYKIETLMHPVRDLFSAVFFVSIGMLIEPALLAKYALPIFIITIVVVLGKVLTCSLGSFVAGNDMRTSLRVGMGLAQIGEFSFIIASLGLTLNVTSDFIYPIAVAVSSLTTLFTPYLIKSSDVLVEWFDRVAPRPLLQAIDAYSERVGKLSTQNGSRIERRILGKLGGQIAVNLLIVAGIFIGAVFLHNRVQAWWPELSRRRRRHQGSYLADRSACQLSAPGRRLAKDRGRSDARGRDGGRFGEGRVRRLRASGGNLEHDPGLWHWHSCAAGCSAQFNASAFEKCAPDYARHHGDCQFPFLPRRCEALLACSIGPARHVCATGGSALAAGSPQPATAVARGPARNGRNSKRHTSRWQDDRRAEAAHPDGSERRWYRTPWQQHRKSQSRRRAGKRRPASSDRKRGAT